MRPLVTPCRATQLGALLVDAELRILQVDRLDAVARHRHDDAGLRDGLFGGVAEHASSAGVRGWPACTPSRSMNDIGSPGRLR